MTPPAVYTSLRGEASVGAIGKGYWLLQINCGQPVLRGPYATDAERENEFDMCLIDPGNEYIILIDPGTVPHPNTPHAWRASKEYERERLDRLDNLEDE